jgi:peptide deformylase
VHDDVQRHAAIRIGYHDLDGNTHTEESEGLRAVCHQHEIDQLNGLFWIQRLSRLKRERLIRRFEKLMRGVRRGGASAEAKAEADCTENPNGGTRHSAS